MDPAKPKHALTLQDMLAGVTCIAIVAGAIRVMTAHSATDPNLFRLPTWYLWLRILSWTIFFPGGIGAAAGCFTVGWRRAWRLALLGIGLIWGLIAVVSLVFWSFGEQP